MSRLESSAPAIPMTVAAAGSFNSRRQVSLSRGRKILAYTVQDHRVGIRYGIGLDDVIGQALTEEGDPFGLFHRVAKHRQNTGHFGRCEKASKLSYKSITKLTLNLAGEASIPKMA